MSPAELKSKFPNASAAFIRKNLCAGGGVESRHAEPKAAIRRRGPQSGDSELRTLQATPCRSSDRPARTIPKTKITSSYNALLVRCYWRDSGIPDAETEYRFDSRRKWRFDFAWPMLKLALEVEGGVWAGGRHTRGKGFIRDMEKYNAASVAGWRVLRCVPDLLCAAETANLIKRAMIKQADSL